MAATDPSSSVQSARTEEIGPTHVPRWVGPFFGALAVALVPWTIYLAITLPQRTTSTHYALAWAGFDVGLMLALGGTAYLTWRHHHWLPIIASVAATMLIVDAWFDVTTAPDRSARIQAVASAAVLEVPLALCSFWLALHAQEIIERRITVRARRRA